jgi:hypothetical protein
VGEIVNQYFGDLVVGQFAVLGEQFCQLGGYEFQPLYLLLAQLSVTVVISVQTLLGKKTQLAEDGGQLDCRAGQEYLKVALVMVHVHLMFHVHFSLCDSSVLLVKCYNNKFLIQTNQLPILATFYFIPISS